METIEITDMIHLRRWPDGRWQFLVQMPDGETHHVSSDEEGELGMYESEAALDVVHFAMSGSTEPSAEWVYFPKKEEQCGMLF